MTITDAMIAAGARALCLHDGALDENAPWPGQMNRRPGHSIRPAWTFYIGAAKAALEAAEKAAWRPIEEAPMDGSVVLLWKPDERRVGEYTLAGYFDEDGPFAGHWIACAGQSLGYFSEWEGKDQGYPTRFRPLPTPGEPDEQQ